MGKNLVKSKKSNKLWYFCFAILVLIFIVYYNFGGQDIRIHKGNLKGFKDLVYITITADLKFAVITSEIWTSDSDGKNAVKVISAKGFNEFDTLSFSKDKKYIAIISRTKHKIYIVDSTLSSMKSLDLGNLAPDSSRPTWSPDNNYVAFTATNFDPSGKSSSGYDHRDIYKVNVESGDIVNLTKTSDFEEYGQSWSIDGKIISFMSLRKDSNGDIKNWKSYSMNSDGSEQKIIFNTQVSEPIHIDRSTLIGAYEGSTVDGIIKVSLFDLNGSVKKTISLIGSHYASYLDLTYIDGKAYTPFSGGNSRDKIIRIDLASGAQDIINIKNISSMASVQ